MEGIDEIVGEFLVESYENLDQLDRDLVALEADPGERDLLSSVFRTIHTIKGTSGFLAFHQLEAVAHVGENLLAKLRDGIMTMDHGKTDVLLRMVDTVRALLASIEATGVEAGVDVEPVVVAITAHLEETAPPAPEAPADAAPTALPDPVEPPPAEAAPHATVLTGLPVTIPVDGGTSVVTVDVAPDGSTAATETPAPARAPAPAPAPAPEPTPAPAEVPAAKQASPANNGGKAKRGAAESSVRVDTELLDDLMRLVGELVLTRNQIVQQTSAASTKSTDIELLGATQRLNLIASELQEGVMKTRMQPIDALWNKFPRVVRDLGAQCGKHVRLEMVGKDTELDRTLLEAVKDPLTHLIRNSVDHGIETPDVRMRAGKAPEGVLTLRARHESGQVLVEVVDDGGGIDGARIGAKAVEKGVLTEAEAERMSPTELLQLIFAPGFSTAAAVTNVSGRGVGMDVVKTNIESIGGTIEVESVPGEGTVCRLRIPLTLAIVPALTIVCAGERYALPQVSLLELVALDAEKAATAVETVGGAPVYRLRGELLPMVALAEVLGLEDRSTRAADDGIVMAVLRSEGKRFGLVVDKIINTEEIVVKAVSKQLKAVGLYSGATILGDGAVALILDVQALSRRAMRSDAPDRALTDTGSVATVAARRADQVLVCDVGGGRRAAIPLPLVTRLERLPASSVESVGHREVVQYRGAILPLIRASTHLGTGGWNADPSDDRATDDLEVVVFSERGRSVALVVSEVLDVVDAAAATPSDVLDQGLLGSMVVDDRVTELLDVRSAVIAADPHFYDAEDLARENASSAEHLVAVTIGTPGAAA